MIRPAMKRMTRKSKSVTAKRRPAKREEALCARVVEIVEDPRGHVVRSVNSAIIRLPRYSPLESDT
jgi:hypothetical protein